MNLKNYIITDQSITIITDAGLFSVTSGTPAFTKIKDLLDAHDFVGAVNAIHVPTRLNAYSGGRFTVVDGSVYYNNEVLPVTISQRLLDFCDNNLDPLPLIRFWENLRLNPSEDSKRDLLAFLEHNHIPITADGCFVGYKMVSQDFHSSSAGVWEEIDDVWVFNSNLHYDHTPGKVVSMPRDKVDPNRNNTCSSGLHVASFNYAHNFGGGHLVEVKVQPKNVVCVPPDYNQEKMRCCEYEVIRECPGVYVKPLYQEDKSFETDGKKTAVEELGEVDKSKKLVEVKKQKLVADRHGRVRIPAAMIKAIGEPGYVVSVRIGDKEVEVSTYTSMEVVGYVIDQYYNIRIGHQVFVDAGLGKRSTFTAEVIDEVIYLR